MAENYKNAFKCHKCPRSNDENGCPAWNEIIMVEQATGEQKIVKGCNFQLMPWIMTEAIKASTLTTGTFSDIKNEIARVYSLIARSLPGFVSSLVEKNKEDIRLIDSKDDK